MTFTEEVQEYLRILPDMGRSSIIYAAAHFGVSRNTLATKLAPISYRTLRRTERVNRFIRAVIANPTLNAREAGSVLGLSGRNAAGKFIRHHIGITFNQYRQHILDGYYEV